MNQNELLTYLLQRLSEPLARYADLDRYYDGKQPLAFLSPEAKVALELGEEPQDLRQPHLTCPHRGLVGVVDEAQHAADRRAALAQEAAVRSAWQTSQSPAAAVPLASVSTRFAIRPSGTSAGGSELIWQAGSAGELLASLRALDGTDARLAQVKVTRNGSAGFSVVAERSP